MSLMNTLSSQDHCWCNLTLAGGQRSIGVVVVVVVVAPHVPRVGAAHLSPAPRGAAQRRRPVGRRSAGDCVAVAAAGGGGECCEGGKKGEIMSRCLLNY